MLPVMIAAFAIGYLMIVFEHRLKINKAASALLTGVVCWTIYVIGSVEPAVSAARVTENMGDISGILFFLLGAMTIVELVDAHCGFDIITDHIRTGNRRKLLWIIAFITFFLSSVLDNLTTTIVMVMFIRKLVNDPEDRFLFAGTIVIAANAGGAWTPIGDVTTTMLWISHRITSLNIMLKVFLASLVNLLIPLIFATFMLKKGNSAPVAAPAGPATDVPEFEKWTVFLVGIGALISVPIFKELTHLPPFMGIILGLGLLWLVTERMHSKKDDHRREKLSIYSALKRMDITSILFFLGILLAVSALTASGVLGHAAAGLGRVIPSDAAIASIIGLISAVIDNVPLVAAGIGMYPLSVYPTDHAFWELLAYAAGTGGSILIIGSAAGIAAMGLEKIEFFKYLKRFSLPALLGYLAGIGVYLLQISIFK